ncbi:MAG: GNAT family N-acetyltransferase [Canidatus Methanoxibalbensis ujae]|nr:GNAT family N-acetyltransferase [Candidatus Methanoxibalbensis ujae]
MMMTRTKTMMINRRHRRVLTKKGASIVIRDFIADDLMKVAEIDRASLLGGSAEIYAALAGISDTADEARNGAMTAGAGAADVFLVAVPAAKEAAETQHVLGFIVTVPVSPHVSRIFALAVHPSMRGKGIGKALLKAALDELRRLQRSFVILEVRESNFAAQNLYKSMNFYETGYIPFYYWDGEGAIVMQKVL